MAATPKRKHSASRKRKRMTSKMAKLGEYVICAYCHQPKPPHVICPNCGHK